ncbi:MAG: DNA polymerase III subunit delta, partial [Desulfobulbaceae bacterium]|nr:DNA polymerase III subunit delta [Desulfobulbaceae bacterium]
MAVYNRKEIPGLLKLINSGEIAPVYLLFGERYLCRSVSDELIGCLLPEEKLSAHNLKNIDGEQEDPANTLNLLRTYSLFSERQVVRVIDSKLLYSKGISKVLWDKAIRASDAKELKQAGRYLREMFSLARISPDREIAEEISDMSGSRWKSLFGFARPSDEDFEWIKEIPADGDEMEQGPGRVETDAAGLYAKAFAKGIPLDNILILVAEAVDKRKSFYKFIKQNGVICDLAVSKGSTKKERDDQDAVLRDLVKKTLSQFGKRLEPKALPLLLDRVGFHPVALVNETEKLAIYTGDAATITMADMNAMVGRTREEALYEFNEAFVDGKIGDTLFILSRLEGNGIHPLVIISTLRNQLRK